MHTGMNDQPCMVLQTRYFLLTNNSHQLQTSTVTVDDIVTEVSAEVYHDGKCSNNAHAFVSAHEVAFDSKGKRSCNLSV
jgi:hypothetical protein